MQGGNSPAIVLHILKLGHINSSNDQHLRDSLGTTMINVASLGQGDAYQNIWEGDEDNNAVYLGATT
jgi:hypothetical protein